MQSLLASSSRSQETAKLQQELSAKVAEVKRLQARNALALCSLCAHAAPQTACRASWYLCIPAVPWATFALGLLQDDVLRLRYHAVAEGHALKLNTGAGTGAMH